MAEAIKYQISIVGIYQWGSGMTLENRKIWKDFFKNGDFIYWKYSGNEDADYLVSVETGAMIHPMDGISIFCKANDYNEHCINELKIIFNKLARIYGTTCKETKEYV